MAVHTKYNSLAYVLAPYTIMPPNLRNFKALHSLIIDAKFTVRIFHHRSLIDYFTSPIPWIMHLLDSISRSNWPSVASLTRITLNLSFSNPFPHELLRLIDKALEALLIVLSIDRFSSLKDVELRILHLDSRGFDLLRQGEAQQHCTQRGWSISSV